MKVDNVLNTAKLKIGYIISFIFILAISIYYYFENINNIYYLSFIGFLSLLYIIIILRKLNYFFIEYLGNKISVKYYTAFPIFRNYKAFEIPRTYFNNYEIKSSLFGFWKTVQFTVKTPKGKFKYPPVSINLLTKKQLNELVAMLDELKFD